MLSHLDDPRPFSADEKLRQAVEARSRELRWRQRLTRTVSAVVVVFALVVAGGALYVLRRDAAIDRIDVSTQPSTDGATNLLVVGPDASGANADSITVVRLEPGGSVRLLSIPRDLWDEQGQSRVNATYGSGVQSLIDSVDRVTGLPIDHYIEVDFEGFVGLVDEFGGLPIAIDRPIRNETTGLHLDDSECTTLDGGTLLALVRARHLQYLDEDGNWHADPTGDLGRIARAQSLMAIALGELVTADTDLAALDRYSRILADHARIDSGLSLEDLVELGQDVVDGGATRTTTDRLPVEAATTPQGASVLHLAPGADQILDSYGSDESSDPAGVAVGTPTDPVVPFAPC